MAKINNKKRNRPSAEDIAEEMYKVDIEALPGWDKVAALSNETKCCGIIVIPDIVIWKDTHFICAFIISLQFTFDDVEDPESFSSDFPASAEGHVKGTKPIIDRIIINTKSFDM